MLRTGQSLVADFSDEITDPARIEDTRRVVRFILDAWNSRKYSRISVLYSHYVSAITQLPIIKPFLPFDAHEIVSFLERIVGVQEQEKLQPTALTIEPSPALILEYTIPMILDALMQETILEARASEHAARMVSMKNAKDAAKKKASLLTLVYNKARQTAITTEITEIVSGVESMKD